MCQMLNGSHLAAIPDMETNRFLTLAVLPHNVDPIYIGALTETFAWQWVTGETYQGEFIFHFRMIISLVNCSLIEFDIF